MRLKPKTTRVIFCWAIAVFFCLISSFVYPSGVYAAVNRPPKVGTIIPSSGTSSPNQAVVFTTTYSDPDGWQNIKQCYFLINNSIAFKNCFYGYYDQNTNKLYLMNDAGTSWLGGFAPGSANTISNSYVSLDCSKTTVLGSGSAITINWNITFKSKFIGFKKTYLKVIDDKNAYNGWLQKGAWTITQLLSISITPKEWNIGSTGINQIITMPSSKKITITNDGTTNETLELKLTNPAGWVSSTSQAQEAYVLSGLICNINNIPQAGSFTSDDIITTTPKKATTAIFAYAGSTANGVFISKNTSRALYLQFKSPTLTNKSSQQDIPITITAQMP